MIPSAVSRHDPAADTELQLTDVRGNGQGMELLL